MRIYVASKNLSKLVGARDAVRLFCPDERSLELIAGYAASGVPEQPMGFEETLRGAEHRLRELLRKSSDAAPSDVFVAVEGGGEERAGRLWLFQVACVVFRGRHGVGQSASYVVPPRIAALVREGMPHVQANRQIIGPPPPDEEDGYGEGTIYYLTNKHVDRATLVEQAVTLALVSGLHPELYADP